MQNLDQKKKRKDKNVNQGKYLAVGTSRLRESKRRG
jgi:hypothetical protein